MTTPSPDAAADAAVPAPIDPMRLRLITWLATAAMFMEVLDGSILNTALPAMAKSFGTTALALNLGVSGYFLALGTFIPVSGWAADRFGARTIFALAITIFTVASALCSVATSAEMFIALRVVQGIGGAMLVPIGRLVVLKLMPQEKLMAAMSSLVWPALIGPVIGPPLGGFITTHFGWQWIFYINIPLGIIALAGVLALVPNVTASRRAFDWPGFLLCAGGTLGLITGFERLGERIDAKGFALLVAGGLLAVVSIRHFRRAAHPMLDLAAFHIDTFRAAIRGGGVVRMTMGSAPFLLPLMFQVGFGYDAFTSGLLLLALFAGNFGMKAFTTQILRRFGYRNTMIWNGVCCALSLVFCALLAPSTPFVLIGAALFFSGAVRSMQFTTTSTIAFADVPKDQMTHANSLYNMAFHLGMAVGITVATLCVRIGGAVAGPLGITAPAANFRIALLLTAAILLIGLIDAVRLPKGAGDHFVAR